MLDIWKKLENIDSDILANYIKNEYPQISAIILMKISPEKRGDIIAYLPENYTTEVLMRISRIGIVDDNVILTIEETLEKDIIKLEKTPRNIDILKETFDKMNPFIRSKYTSLISERNRELASSISNEIILIEELKKIKDEDLNKFIEKCVDKKQLFIALLTMNDEIKDKFIKILPEFKLLKNITDNEYIDQCQKNIVNILKS